jgi:regulator of sigma D
MKITEFNDLKKVYDQIMANLEGSSLDKEQWMEKVLPYISSLKTDLQMFLEDLFEDLKKEIDSSEEADQ